MSWVLGWVWILCSSLFPLSFLRQGHTELWLAWNAHQSPFLSFPESIVTAVSMSACLACSGLVDPILEITLTVDNKSLRWFYISGCSPLLLVLTCSSCCLPVALSFLSKLCSSGVCCVTAQFFFVQFKKT